MAAPAAILDILVTANSAQANAALAKTQGQLVSTSKTATATSATTKKAMLGVGVAAVAAGTELFKIGSEFDKVSDKIRTRTGATGKDLARLEKNFKSVVSTVPTDFDTASEAIAGLNQRLGVTGPTLVKLTRQVISLSKVTGTDVGENVEAITRLFGDWTVATKDQTDTLDGLFRVSQKTGASVSDLARNMVQFGAPLRNLGFDLDQAAAMFGSFEKTGVNITTVLSGLRLAVGNFAKPTTDLARTMDQLNLSAKDTPAAITAMFEQIKNLRSESEATALAIDAFGKRAGPDLVDTIRGGKFELDSLLATFRNGDGTITQSERRTRDFSEQWQLFANRLKVFVEPIATAVFKAVGDAMKAINKIDFKQVFDSLQEFWQKAGLLRGIVTNAFAAMKTAISVFVSFIKPAVKLISSLLTGDFGSAWDAVKDLFRTGVEAVRRILVTFTAPFRAAIGGLVAALRGPLSAVLNFLKRAFAKFADFVLGVVSSIIDGLAKMADASSKLPGPFGDAFDKVQSGLEDTSDAINKSRQDIRDWADSATTSAKQMKHGVTESVDSMATAVSAGFMKIGKATNKALAAFGVQPVAFAIGEGVKSQTKQRGGVIHALTGALVGGYGSGDKVPAMLEPGEVVINRKAVAALGGARRANRINSLIPRFAGGGEVKGGMTAMVARANAWDRSKEPYLWGGGHGAFQSNAGFPVDCSGAVSDVLHAAGLLMGAPMTSGTLMSWGKPATGSEPLVVYANPHHTVMSLNGKAFGTSGSNEGGGAGWIEGASGQSLAPGAMRTMKVAGAVAAEVARQVLKGPAGPLKDLGQAALDKVRGAANRFISSKMPIGSFGGGDAQVPGGMFSAQQMSKLWAATGGPRSQAHVAGAVGMAESGGDPNAVGPPTQWGQAKGLWQILGQVVGGDIFDPTVNAKNAIKKYTDAGGWSPWEAYTNGNYQRYMQRGGIIQKLAGGGIGGQSYAPALTGSIHPPGWASLIASTGGGGEPFKTIARLQRKAAKLTSTDIPHAEIMDAFSWSPGGAELSAGELAGQRGLWQSLIDNLKLTASLLPSAIRKSRGAPKVQKSMQQLLTTINDPTGAEGSLLAAMVGLDALSGAGTGAGTGGEMVSLLQAALMEANLRTAVSQSQYGIFSGAQQGAVVQAPNVNVNISGTGKSWLEQLIRVEVQKETRNQSRSTGAPGSRMAGV